MNKLAGWLTLLLLLVSPVDLFAQMNGPLETVEDGRLSVSAASSYQFKSDVNSGGDVSVSRYFLMIGGSAPISDKVGLGFHLTYDLEDYNFSTLKDFAVPNPWNKIDRVGLDTRLAYKVTEKWNLSIGPVVQYAGERGADFGDSLMYGGIISASYRANSDLVVGFGAGVFYRLEETRVFPSLFLSWQITDQLRLGNSYRLGPTGPAGLELTYLIDKSWEAGLGGGYRSSRFRLDKDGPVPNGIGENDSWPVYARLSRKFGQKLNIDLYGGAAFGGKLRLEDSSGHEISSVSYNTAPLVGLALTSSF